MVDPVTLSSGATQSIRSLQQTDRLQGINQTELATGRQDPRLNVVAELQAKSLSDRAADLAATKDGIDNAQSVIGAAQVGLSSIEDTLDQARAVAQAYERTDDAAEQARLQQQFDDLAQQIDAIAADSGFNGVNLISGNPDTLTVSYGGEDDGALTVEGEASDSAALNLSLSTESVDAALAQVRDAQETLGANAETLGIRADFTEDLQTQLEAGAADLVNSDIEEDAAEALALQTRQQLSAESLNIAAQSERAVLQLF